MLTHYHLIFEVESGLNMMFLELGTGQLGAKNIVQMMTRWDWLFLSLPLLAFGLAHLYPTQSRRASRLVFGSTVLFIAAGQFQFGVPAVAHELTRNPVHFLAHDLLRAPLQFYFGKPNPYADRADLPGDAQLNSIKLVDEAFVLSGSTNRPPPTCCRWRRTINLGTFFFS